MTLTPQARLIVDQMAETFPPPDPSIGGVEMREIIRARAGDVIPHDAEPVGAVKDLDVPGPLGPIGVRIYRPLGAGELDVLPLVVFFHGGGWVLCDLDSHDGFCRTLTNATGCCVAAVDYRRAPEHKFPAPAEDSYAAFQWLTENAAAIGADGARVAVAGDSAGGNLAAVVALMARDRGGPSIAFQLLMYPVIDHRFDTPSHLAQGTTNGLTSAEVQYYWREYLEDDADGADPYASPLRAESHAGLPPALLILPEHDPLRSEGEAFGTALRGAGGTATVSIYDGMFHSFLMFVGVLGEADEALAEMATALRTALGIGSG